MGRLIFVGHDVWLPLCWFLAMNFPTVSFTLTERAWNLEQICDEYFNLTDADPILGLSYNAPHLKETQCTVTVLNVAKYLQFMCVESTERTFHLDCETVIVIRGISNTPKVLTCSSEAPSNLCGHTQSISISFERQVHSDIKSGLAELHIYASDDVKDAVPGTVIVTLLSVGGGVVFAVTVSVIVYVCYRKRKSHGNVKGHSDGDQYPPPYSEKPLIKDSSV